MKHRQVDRLVTYLGNRYNIHAVNEAAEQLADRTLILHWGAALDSMKAIFPYIVQGKCPSCGERAHLKTISKDMPYGYLTCDNSFIKAFKFWERPLFHLFHGPD